MTICKICRNVWQVGDPQMRYCRLGGKCVDTVCVTCDEELINRMRTNGLSALDTIDQMKSGGQLGPSERRGGRNDYMSRI